MSYAGTVSKSRHCFGLFSYWPKKSSFTVVGEQLKHFLEIQKWTPTGSYAKHRFKQLFSVCVCVCVCTLSAMIEQKVTRVGDLDVEIQEMKNDPGDTADGLADDAKCWEILTRIMQSSRSCSMKM